MSLADTVLDSDFIAHHPGMTAGPYLRLTVSDTGHGMTPDVLEQIFNPFFTTKKRGEGTGMGLSVVHGIIKDHGGTISVYSEPGKGSTFQVYIPVVELESKPGVDTEKPVPTGDERILFIDDEQSLVELGQQILERLGYQVVTGTRSVDALELFRAKADQFDLVISDMTMPQMTGMKLAEEIKRIRPDIPIILCTGFSKQVIVESGQDMGIVKVLLKPLVTSELANAVREALDG